jgi:hypothetical protein
MAKMAQIRQISKLKKIQIAIVLWYLPGGSQEYRRILFLKIYFHIYYVAKFG